MSAKSHQIVDRLADQLGGFEDQLRVSGTGAEVLGEIKESIGALLTMDIDNENVVRRMLRERLEQGLLRKNSFRVAVSILDQSISDTTATRLRAANASDAAKTGLATESEPEQPATPINDPSFDSTVVIPKKASAKAPRRKEVRPGLVLGERFLLDAVVSNGSIGTLYVAYDQNVEAVHKDETRVAVTILSPDIAGNVQAIATLQKISRRARRLAHPNIEHFVDFCRDDDVVFLATEWIDGRSLADILDSGDACRIDRIAAFRIVRELGNALDYGHRCGVVHADLKPGNIMIAQDGCARLVDSVTARAKLLRLRSHSGEAAANTTYASPQVLMGERLSASDDVFSLGCLLYRLLAGYRVFGPRNAADAFEAGMQPQRPEDLKDSQWHALSQALRHEREDRFESVPDFMAALDGADGVMTSARGPRLGDRKGKKRSGAWILAAVVTVVLVTAGAYFAGLLTTGTFEAELRPSGDLVDAARNTTSGGGIAGLVPRQTVLVSAAALEDDGDTAIEPELSIDTPVEILQVDEITEFTAAVSTDRVKRLSEMPVNAVGFADDHVVIHETESAVQIDITRFNPDRQSLSVGFFVNDITAKEGQDYFAPNSYSIPFGPGQETARLLIPLVQDSVTEGNETFVIRLTENDIAPAVVEAQSIVVTIRDDAPQSP